MNSYNMKKMMILAVGALMVTSVWAQKSPSQPALKDVLGKYFLVGAAVDRNLPAGEDPQAETLVKAQFNQVVAENCMKGELIHPEVNRYDWTDADRLVDWSQRHGMTLIGHCLVWHSQPPKWIFTDETGKNVSRETLIGRMYSHIMTIVTRYRGKIKGWDVVNEAFEDDGSYRKTPYYNIIGPEYLALAFQFAHEADPDAELYYNDYSMSKPGKREAVCQLVRQLKAKGIRIDAVGMQSHNGYNYPDYSDYEKSLEAFAAEGVKVMLTELDMNMLPNPKDFNGAEISQNFKLMEQYNPYVKGLDKKAQKLFNQRYLDLFRIVERHKDVISRVTFWGVNDSHTWLNDWPVKGRTNYPMLFDRDYQAKPVVKDILKLFE